MFLRVFSTQAWWNTCEPELCNKPKSLIVLDILLLNWFQVTDKLEANPLRHCRVSLKRALAWWSWWFDLVFLHYQLNTFLVYIWPVDLNGRDLFVRSILNLHWFTHNKIWLLVHEIYFFKLNMYIGCNSYEYPSLVGTDQLEMRGY